MGGAAFKIATAAVVVSGGTALGPTLLRLISGFGADGAVALGLVVLARGAARLAAALGVVVGLLGAVDVFFALAFGGPLTPAQRAWGHAADLALVAPVHVAAALVAVVCVVVAAAATLARPPPTRVVVAACVAAIVGGGVGAGVDHALDAGHARRQAGLSTQPLLALLPQPDPVFVDRAAHDAVDDPGPGPVDPALSAAVVVDRARRPRHVVLYLAESTAARFVDEATMPQLSRLMASSSVTFTQHVAESPISIKAIFSVLCGLHPLPADALETAAIPRVGCASLPEVLTAAGFDAALFHGGYFAFTDKLAFLNQRGFSALVDGENHPRRASSWTNGWGIDDRVVVDEALRWLDARPDPTKPSLLVVIPLIPHYEYFLPPDAPKPFGTRTLVDRYKNALRFSDDVYARLVDGYRRRGLFDDTLFVFVGDHGEAFDEHPRNRLHGSFLYEENVRAPLVLTSTASFPRAQTSKRPSAHADLLPTILDLLGLPLPQGALVQGQSLVADDYRPRSVPLFTAVPTTKVGVRGPRWKLIHDVKEGSDELYDLVADPGERTNLAEEEAAVAATLRRRALRFLKEQRHLLTSLPARDPGYLPRVAAATGLPLVDKKVFNMKRRCLAFHTSLTEETVLELGPLSPPARLFGIGMDDESRFAKKGALAAHVTHAGGSFDVVVDDRFETSSAVRDVPPSDVLTVRLAPQAKAATGCVWLAP